MKLHLGAEDQEKEHRQQQPQQQRAVAPGLTGVVAAAQQARAHVDGRQHHQRFLQPIQPVAGRRQLGQKLAEAQRAGQRVDVAAADVEQGQVEDLPLQASSAAALSEEAAHVGPALLRVGGQVGHVEQRAQRHAQRQRLPKPRGRAAPPLLDHVPQQQRHNQRRQGDSCQVDLDQRGQRHQRGRQRPAFAVDEPG